MSDTELKLLRKRIDQIDDNILDLLLKRNDLARTISEVKKAKEKKDFHIYRPERQASILERLILKSENLLSPLLIHKIWEEIFGSHILLQGGIIVMVPNDIDFKLNVDSTKALVGRNVKIIKAQNYTSAIEKLKNYDANLVAFRFPGEEENSAWWIDGHLFKNIYIVASSPFLYKNDKNYLPSTVILSRKKPMPSGNDVSIFRSDIKKNKRGLRLLAKIDNKYLYLIDKYVSTGDKELKYLGSYPKPIAY